MERLGERETIIRKIKVIAEEGGKFTCFDCMSKHLTDHFIASWEEVLGELVELGYLKGEGKGFDDRLYQLVKEDTMETQVKPVYKALKEVDGRLESLTTLGGNLTYTEGQITYAPEGSMGIFVEPTLKGARDIGLGNWGYKDGGLVVHEITPLGGECPRDSTTFGNLLRYPAILLGKEVWREEPKPESSFKVGDKVVGTYANSTGEVFIVDHITGKEVWFTKGTWLSDSQIRLATEEETRPEPKFKVGDKVRGTGGSFVGKIYTIEAVSWSSVREAYDYSVPEHTIWECNLELAPVEEWVDVTQECTLTMSGREGRVSVRHGGSERLLLGSKEVKLWCCQDGDFPKDNYKVELTDGAYSCGAFKVSKLVKH